MIGFCKALSCRLTSRAALALRHAVPRSTRDMGEDTSNCERWGKERRGESAGRGEPDLQPLATAPLTSHFRGHPTPPLPPRMTRVPGSISHLQCQWGAVDIPKVALRGLGLQDLLLHCPNSRGDPLSQIRVEGRALKADKGQACHGHCVWRGTRPMMT